MTTFDIQVSTKKIKVKKVPVQIFLEPELAEQIAELGSKDVAIGKKVKAIIKFIMANKDIKLNLE